jgi:hypothetical protein
MQKVAALIVSIYITAVIYSNAFFIKTLTVVKDSSQLFWNYLAIFLIILVLVYLLVNKTISVNLGRGHMRPIRTLMLTFGLVGLVLSVLYHIVPIEPMFDLPQALDRIFASDVAFTAWLVLPLLALFI